MADNIMDAFLLYVGSDDEIREELDRRIMSWKGDKREITKHVLIPFAAEHGYIMTEEDVELYNGHENDGSEVPSFLFEEEGQPLSEH